MEWPAAIVRCRSVDLIRLGTERRRGRCGAPHPRLRGDHGAALVEGRGRERGRVMGMGQVMKQGHVRGKRCKTGAGVVIMGLGMNQDMDGG